MTLQQYRVSFPPAGITKSRATGVEYFALYCDFAPKFPYIVMNFADDLAKHQPLFYQIGIQHVVTMSMPLKVMLEYMHENDLIIIIDQFNFKDVLPHWPTNNMPENT